MMHNIKYILNTVILIVDIPSLSKRLIAIENLTLKECKEVNNFHTEVTSFLETYAAVMQAISSHFVSMNQQMNEWENSLRT